MTGASKDQRGRSEHDVARTLQDACHAAERSFANGNERHATDLAESRLHQVERRQVRNEVDRRGRVAQGVKQRPDPWLLRDRHAYVDDVDLVLARVLRKIGEPAEQERPDSPRQALGAPVVEESFHAAVPRLFGQSRRKLAADPVRTDDYLAAPGVTMLEYPAGEFSRCGVCSREHEGRQDEPRQHDAARKKAAGLQQEPGQQQDPDDAGPFDRPVAQDAPPVHAVPDVLEPRPGHHLECHGVREYRERDVEAVELPSVADGREQQGAGDDRGIQVFLDQRDRRRLADAGARPAARQHAFRAAESDLVTTRRKPTCVYCGHPYPRNAGAPRGCTNPATVVRKIDRECAPHGRY